MTEKLYDITLEVRSMSYVQVAGTSEKEAGKAAIEVFKESPEEIELVVPPPGQRMVKVIDIREASESSINSVEQIGEMDDEIDDEDYEEMFMISSNLLDLARKALSDGATTEEIEEAKAAINVYYGNGEEQLQPPEQGE